MIEGVHEHGCGFEAQNEAWYRFLVQPDPFDQITKNGTQARSCRGIDATILQQRHDFLRPDSLLAIIVVTDENEEAADPLSIGGQGWAFDNQNFPGSPNGASPAGHDRVPRVRSRTTRRRRGRTTRTAPRARSSSGDPSFATRCPKDGANGANGYLDPNNDTLNTRFYHQKLRFGLFAGYPTSRYVRGLQKVSVPDSQPRARRQRQLRRGPGRERELRQPDLRAEPADRPDRPGDALCNLTRGTRTPDLVYYAAIAGVPHELLQATPGDGTCPAGHGADGLPAEGHADGRRLEAHHGQRPRALRLQRGRLPHGRELGSADDAGRRVERRGEGAAARRT